jgi:hypothetical protein
VSHVGCLQCCSGELDNVVVPSDFFVFSELNERKKNEEEAFSVDFNERGESKKARFSYSLASDSFSK